MQQQRLKVPAVCSRCGGLFDMAYDLRKINASDEADGMEMALSWKNRGKALCWECRLEE